MPSSRCVDWTVEKLTLRGFSLLLSFSLHLSFPDASRLMDCYDPVTREWTSKAPMRHVRMNLGIFGLAGYSSQPETTLFSFSSFCQPRSAAAAVALGGKLYVMGGWDNHTSNWLKWVECYDPEKDEWIDLQPMNSPRRGCSAAILDGLIYVVGGSYQGVTLDSVER